MSLKILLDDKINKLLEDNPELKSLDKNKFEKAVAAIVNVRYLHGIDFDDLVKGMMGNGGDEGIDLCYLFLNGKLIYDEAGSINDINSQSKIVLKLFQIKKEDSFSTDGFRKFIEGIKEIFTLDLSLEKLQQIGVNKQLREEIDLIRRVFRQARLENSDFSVECYFATAAISDNYSEKIKHLQSQLQDSLSIYRTPVVFSYWTAQDLLNFTDKREEKIEFQFEGQPVKIAEKDVLTSGYVGFINGNSLMNCLTDNTGRFKDELTDGNIRFFLGEDKTINSSIIETALSEERSKNFWAMNNGITIIGEDLTPTTKDSILVKNPQIVNGCQTVHCLYNAYKDNNTNSLPGHLKVFIKLVKTENSNINSEIISATNSQNPVKAISLKANENIQRNIEKHLLKYDIYYERRENYYKMQGKTGLRVISLERLTQIMHSIINKQPVTAINDTTSIIHSENIYKTLFHEAVDYDVYRFGCELYLKIWSLKNSDIRSGNLKEREKDIVSKGGYLLLAIVSSLILSEAEFTRNGQSCKQEFLGIINISIPQRKNDFSIRKNNLFLIINNDAKFERFYIDAKRILLKAIKNYEKNTGRNYTTLFKVRTFDKEYLMPAINQSTQFLKDLQLLINQATLEFLNDQ